MAEDILPPGFGENDPEFIQEEYEKSKKLNDGSGDNDNGKVRFFKIGITLCRILPPHEDAKSWFCGFKEHKLHPDGKFATVTCPTSIDEPCPICEYGKELYSLQGADNIKKSKKLYFKDAYFYNAYIYNSPDGKGLEQGIVVLKSGPMVYKQLMQWDNDEAGGWGNISSITNGFDFRIERKGKGRFDTEYTVTPNRERSNLLEKLAAEGTEIGQPHDLTKIFPPKSYEELVKILDSAKPYLLKDD